MADKLRERLEEIGRAEKGQNAYSRSVLALVGVAGAAVEMIDVLHNTPEEWDTSDLRAALAKLTEEVKP